MKKNRLIQPEKEKTLKEGYLAFFFPLLLGCGEFFGALVCFPFIV